MAEDDNEDISNSTESENNMLKAEEQELHEKHKIEEKKMHEKHLQEEKKLHEKHSHAAHAHKGHHDAEKQSDIGISPGKKSLFLDISPTVLPFLKSAPVGQTCTHFPQLVQVSVVPHGCARSVITCD